MEQKIFDKRLPKQFGDCAATMLQCLVSGIIKNVLSVFVAGIAFGKFAEKIDRLIRKLEEEEHKDAHKNDRR